MQTKASFISIVLPNYNGGNFVLKTVDSLMGLAYPDDRFEIIIVDNGSTDGLFELIKQHYAVEIKSEKIKFIELGKNFGAPYAYNTGIKKASLNSEFILKMDNDLILEKDCLNELKAPFENDKRVGVTGGKVYYYSQKNRIHLIGSKISPFYGGGIGIGRFKLDNKKFDRQLKVDAVNGCLMLIRKDLLERVGLMDENYFLYFDDIDLSLKIKSAGFKQVYCYKARAYHNTSTPDKRFQSEKWLHYAIYNSFYFMKKNYRGLNRCVFFLAINFRVGIYIFGVLKNNKADKRISLLFTILDSYKKGLKCLWKKESL